MRQVDDASIVVLPMPRPYLPIPTWFTGLELLALIVVPVWLLCSGLIRAIFRIEPPPRVTIAIDPDGFTMCFCDRDTGERTTFNCSSDCIAEFRKNRLEPGLWVHAKGVTMETFLRDIDDATIEELTRSVREILGLEVGGCAEHLATEQGSQ